MHCVSFTQYQTEYNTPHITPNRIDVIKKTLQKLYVSDFFQMQFGVVGTAAVYRDHHKVFE